MCGLCTEHWSQESLSFNTVNWGGMMTGESATPSHPCSHIRQDPFTSDSDQSLIPHLPLWPHYNVRTCLGLEWPYHPQLWWSRSSVLTKTWSLLENKILQTCNNLTVQFPIFHQSSFCNIIIRCWESSSNMSWWRMMFSMTYSQESRAKDHKSSLCSGWMILFLCVARYLDTSEPVSWRVDTKYEHCWYSSLNT